MEIIFLGSGGGRAMVYTQKRKTSGFYLNLDIKMYVDPGVGAFINYITNFKKFFDIKNLDYIFVSHAHIDHAHDLIPFIDYITVGGKKVKKGILLASYSVIKGNYYGPFINRTYLDYLTKYEIVDNKEEYILKKEYKLKIIQNKHTDPTTYSFRLKNEKNNVDIGYLSDSFYFEELSHFFNGVDILIANCLRPFEDKHPYHLTANNILQILKDMEKKPKLVVLHHLGFKFEGKEIETIKRFKKEGFNTILSHEGLKIDIQNKKIEYLLKKPYYYNEMVDLYRYEIINRTKKGKKSAKVNYEEKIKEMLMELKKQLNDNIVSLNQTWVDKRLLEEKKED